MNETEKPSEKDWKSILSAEQFYILRKKGTEAPFTGKYWNNMEEGTYFCAGCNTPLFSSKDKFLSGCGWPSFTQVLSDGKVIVQRDTSHGMIREEVICKQCGGHLGHIFDDGPPPTGKRFCINSGALFFKDVIF